jgi:hypothetical protein
MSHSTPPLFERQEQSSEPIYIEPGDHILHYASCSMDANTLRLMAQAFLRLADEKEGVS